MKILSAQQIRDADADTLRVENIRSSMLMERAARACSNWIMQNLTDMEPVHIFCGTGNNGGDGLCIARHLFLEGMLTRVFIVGDPDQCSADFALNMLRLQRLGMEEIYLFEETDPEDASDCIVIIDAIFGTGLNRKPEGIHATAISCILDSAALCIAIDLPSGFLSDDLVPGVCVEADITLCFQSPRLSFFFPGNAQYIGQWHVLNIGLSDASIALADTPYTFVTAEDVLPFLLKRNTFSHKGNYGHSLIIGGNTDMEGAAILSGMACLRIGSGLVSISSPGGITEHPELMHIHSNTLERSLQEKKFNAIGLGPGLHTDAEAKKMCTLIFEKAQMPLVIDADALNMLAEYPEMRTKIPHGSILTPHPKEYARLFGATENWMDLIRSVKRNAADLSCYIVYKKAFTMIATPDGAIYFNSSGNAGMATAGSGDVLTGMITGLLAQGYTSEFAAVTAVFLHGLAGDMAMEDMEGENLIAGDIVDAIPHAMAIFS